MKISGRNQVSGLVTRVEKDGIIAKVTMDIDRGRLTAVITSDAVEDLAIGEGDKVTALIKSTSVMIMK